MAFECTKCSSGERVAVGVVFFSAFVVAGVALVRYLVANEREGGGNRGFITRVKDKVSFRSLKIVVVVWQILTQASFYKVARQVQTSQSIAVSRSRRVISNGTKNNTRKREVSVD